MIHAPEPADQPSIPAHRVEPAKAVADCFRAGQRIAITTHVNSDGDGVGSEAALWHALTALGVRAAITNPTTIPDRFRFLLEGIESADKSRAAVRYLQRADAIVVLDISDVGRLGHLSKRVAEPKVPVICVDHHVSNGTLPPGARLIDSAACATGELIYDLARVANWTITPEIARALYVAILTDTGGFRFSNTSPRALAIAADLLRHNLDPDEIYREVYASNPEGRIRIMGEVADTLVVEPDHDIAWVTVPAGALERHRLDPDQLEGLVELPRSIRGVRLAMLFRTLSNARVKISFRSVGDVDVAALAERFGGGGHRKAAGASVAGSLADVQDTVLAAAREVMKGQAANDDGIVPPDRRRVDRFRPPEADL